MGGKGVSCVSGILQAATKGCNDLLPYVLWPDTSRQIGDLLCACGHIPETLDLIRHVSTMWCYVIGSPPGVMNLDI